jgi:hypothetical protein
MRRLACLLGVAAGLTLGAVRAADDRVGVATHFDQGWKPAEMMPLLDQLGAGWIRDGVPWGDVEPAKHHYVVPAQTAAWLNAAHEHHLHVLLILYYANKNYADPFSPPDYAKAAAFLAKALAGRIDAIEILNEPNNPPFYSAYGGAWNGNEPDGKVSAWVKKYAELIQAAVPAIKAANPRLKVVGYGAPAPATFRIMRLGVPPQLDGITDHPYFGSMTLPEFVPYPATPSLLQRDGIATADLAGTYRSQCAMFRAESARDGLPHAELWNTEWGCATWINEQGNPPFSILPDTQAVYVLRRLLEARALGVMTFYYDLRDDGNDRTQEWENFGLLDYFHQPKPAFAAFQRFTAMFAGLEASGDSASIVADGAVRCYAYRRAGLSDRWLACWKVAAFPDPAPVPSIFQLSAEGGFHHAVATDLYTGQESELPVESDGNGHSTCDIDPGVTPVVVHFCN